MLIDSTTESSFADDNKSTSTSSSSVLLANTSVVVASDTDHNRNNDHDDEDDDGYSIVSLGVSVTDNTMTNVEGTTESTMDSNGMDESLAVASVTTTILEPHHLVSIVTKESETDDDDSATEFAFVDHTPDDVSNDTNEVHHRNDGVDDSPNTEQTKNEGNCWDGMGMILLVVMFAMIVRSIVPVLLGTSQNARLQNEIDLYKQQLQAQHLQVMQFKDEILHLEYEALVMQEQHKNEIEMWQQRMRETQAQMESRPDPKESVEKLQEQVHQLLEEATAMEATSNQEIRRYQRGYRELQKEHERCHEVVSFQAQSLHDFTNLADQCSLRKRQLKKEFNKVKKELQSVQHKLRKETKELKDTSKEVKRQKKVILKLQKQLVDIESKKAETRKQKQNQRHSKSSSNESTSSSSFAWDNFGGRSFRADTKSILVDNCWMYVQAQMDWGECFYDMTDHVKDHFHTMGHTMSQSFHNAMKHLRQEMEQQHYHPAASESSPHHHHHETMMEDE